jgi:DNA-binding MarR family transcriptional regulator
VSLTAPPQSAAEDPLALERQVCFALAVASREVIALYRPVLAPLGLTHPQYLVMLALWERDERSLRDLADTLALEPATLSPLLKRLEASGLVRRRRHRADERLLAVTLTAQGRALRRRAEKVPEQIVARLDMPVSELLELNAALRRVIDAATAGGDAP